MGGILLGHLRLVPYKVERAPPVALQQRWLTQNEIAKMRDFRQPADQWRMLAGRALLRGCLQNYFGIAFADFAFGEHNKPILQNGTKGRAIDLNLTHDGCNVIAGFSASCDVGVDVATVDDFLSWEDFGAGYLDPAEMAWVRSSDRASGPWRALRLWTLKEAILKSTGHGLDIDPRELVLSPDASSPFVRIPPTLPPASAFHLREWRCGASAGAALASVKRTCEGATCHRMVASLRSTPL